MEKILADLRENYGKNSLSEKDCPENPFDLFQLWLNEAMKNISIDPNAMTVCTVDALGRPSARTVLLKGISDEGFMFYTHYTSKKGREIAENPNVSLLIWWRELERQVRIDGIAEKVSREKSEIYFHTRPKGSQIGAAASPQSTEISKEALEENFRLLNEKFAKEDEIPLPDNWGGYLVKPRLIEFWQGRPNRMHDRVEYQCVDSEWKKRRLAP